ncbi:MAG: hypothetical protein ACREQZ_08365, partial [Woeseiaceae bacterium]
MKHALFAYLKRLLRYAPCLWFAVTALSRAETVEEAVYSPVLERTWKYSVYLPPSFDSADGRTYAVLF